MTKDREADDDPSLNLCISSSVFTLPVNTRATTSAGERVLMQCVFVTHRGRVQIPAWTVPSASVQSHHTARSAPRPRGRLTPEP